MPEIDMSDTGCVRIGDFRLAVGPVKWGLLKVLADAKGRTVTYETLTARVYGARLTSGNCINVHICHLRRRLKGSGITIKNRSGFGYFIAPE